MIRDSLTNEMRRLKDVSRKDLWNRSNRVGCPVLVVRDDLSDYESETTSEAFLLHQRIPVVRIKGSRVPVSLDRVQALAELSRKAA